MKFVGKFKKQKFSTLQASLITAAFKIYIFSGLLVELILEKIFQKATNSELQHLYLHLTLYILA